MQKMILFYLAEQDGSMVADFPVVFPTEKDLKNYLCTVGETFFREEDYSDSEEEYDPFLDHHPEPRTLEVAWDWFSWYYMELDETHHWSPKMHHTKTHLSTKSRRKIGRMECRVIPTK